MKPALPSRQLSNYQFPVYRWIGWLAVAGFAIGLTAMFFISDLFGVPAPLGWSALVILFCVGAMLLDRPKLLLGFMLFYFMLMPGNRLFGLLWLPMPGFIDEVFFLPFIAVIVMNWIQRRQLKEATLFPLAFCLIAALSWYVNGKTAPFTAVQVTLIMLKSYILWYYCRLTCTFEDDRQLARWIWIYILYAAIQFLYNILWQGGPWVRTHPDSSGGVFGPERVFGGAHIVGYISVFALLILAGWWGWAWKSASSRQRFWVGLCAVVILYNLVFMTDTKHALVLFPFVFLPFLLHPRLPGQLRLWLVASGLLFVLSAGIYFHMSMDHPGAGTSPLKALKNSPKGEIFYAVTVDFPQLVNYPLLGAGPGRFTSDQASKARTPLARRYLIPYADEQRRMAYWGRGGAVAQASIMGIVGTDFFKLMGEFGWLGTVCYYAFVVWIAVQLYRKSLVWPQDHLASGLFVSLSCCVIFLMLITLLIGASTMPVVAFPLWMLIGRIWDMKLDGVGEEPA